MFSGQWSVVHQRPNEAPAGRGSEKFIFVDNFDLSSSFVTPHVQLSVTLASTVLPRCLMIFNKVMGFGHENPSCEDPTWTNNEEGANSNARQPSFFKLSVVAPLPAYEIGFGLFRQLPNAAFRRSAKCDGGVFEQQLSLFLL